MSCGISRKHSSHQVLLWLWLWCWLAAAAPIRPLAWEHPYAAGAALKGKKKKKKEEESCLTSFFCISCIVFPVPFIEETVISPLYIFASFVID